MKRFFIFLFSLVTILSVTLTAFAEKLDLVDKSYDFTKLKSIYLYDINLDVLDDPDKANANIESSLINKVMEHDYIENAEKFAVYDTLSPEKAMRKISLATGQDLNKMFAENPVEGSKFFTENLHLIVDAYIEAELLEYFQSFYVIPAHMKWETITTYKYYTDRNGIRQSRPHTRTVPVYVPDQRVNTANVKIKISLIDAKTKKEIFAREESRVNIYSTDCRECYQQIIRSFFRELKKKIKK